MKNKDIVVILDNIRSRENVGSIFRTADAVGVAKIYLCGITPTPRVGSSNYQIPNSKQAQNSKFQIQNTDKIAKTALGAEKWVPWEYYKQTWRLIEKLKEDGYQVLALEKTKTAKDIFSAKGGSASGGRTQNKLITLVIGNEVSGLSPKILKRANEVVSIPMCGQKESLNVAVAFGIAVYQFFKNDN